MVVFVVFSVLLIALIVGLLKPSLILPWSKKPSRWKVLGWWFFVQVVMFVVMILSYEKQPGMYNGQDEENTFLYIEALDSTEVADRGRKSFRPAEISHLFHNGWVYISQKRRFRENDKWVYSFSRNRLSDFKSEKINEITVNDDNHRVLLIAVEDNWLYFYHSYREKDTLRSIYVKYDVIYKQSMLTGEKITLKEIKVENTTSVAEGFKNFILYDGRLYYATSVLLRSISAFTYDIYSMNTDGSDDKILSERYYYDFCIYKDMIFARNHTTLNLEKLNLNNGKIIDNYGVIKSHFFDIYDDFIYYFDEKYKIYKKSIKTKRTMLFSNNDFSKSNPVIARNKLFFNTSEQNYYPANVYGMIEHRTFGDLFSIKLDDGKLDTIYTVRHSYLLNVYNGYIYGSEFILSDLDNNRSMSSFRIDVSSSLKTSLPFNFDW